MRSSPLSFVVYLRQRECRVLEEELDQLKVVRLELHEDLMKLPQYRALLSLTEIIRVLEKTEAVAVEALKPTPIPEPPKPEPEPEPPKPEPPKPQKKQMTQVQALFHVLNKKDGAASLGWLLAELEFLGVRIGGASPRRTLGVALSSNKELFRRVQYEGGRFMWGLRNRRYMGEITLDHLPATEFRSMRVSMKK